MAASVACPPKMFQCIYNLNFFTTFYLLTCILPSSVYSIGEVIYAVNCGGPSHTDLNGVHYQSDRLSIGTSSDFGRSSEIARVPSPDQILYQTERYHVADFGYTIPVKEDGDFVLVLKFSEVYFHGSKLKVFDVRLNHQHIVIKDIDIYDKVGFAVGHDEYIPFQIKSGNLIVKGESSPFSSLLYVEFLKTYYDNPKINAIVVFKGSVEDVPKLQTLDTIEDEPQIEKDEEEPPVEEEIKPQKDRKTSGPKTPDPYESEDTSFLYPILIAIGLFIPTVFCLCRL